MAHRKLEFSTRLTREDVAGLIEAIVDGLKDGSLKVQKSGETLELDVPRVVDLEIEAEVDDERAEFEIEVSWRTNRAENPDMAPGGAEDQARSTLAKAARKLDASAKKAAGTMKKFATAKKMPQDEAAAKAKDPGGGAKAKASGGGAKSRTPKKKKTPEQD